MTKKQIIQLSALVFSFYLVMFFLITDGWEYYSVFGFMTLMILSALYIIYSQKDYKFIKYLRILLYFILGYFIYSIIDNILLGYFSSFYYGSRLQSFWFLLRDSFSLLYALIVSAVLILNKPPKSKVFKIGKIKISL